ncbi:MAG TPA: S1 RNA-binding domain-containing protein [Anaerolineae bacterium]|nr:S1 RNA-binding domain-containing protein [Anaerolineae bacterium]
MERDEEIVNSELTAAENETTPEDSHPMDALLAEEEFGLRSPQRGEIRTGKIARVTETDILVDVGAKSEGVIISQELEQLPEEERAELTVGKEITVYVVKRAGRDGTLLLSLKRAEEEQDWHTAEKLMSSQEVFEGEVAGYNKGGLIVKLGRLRGFIPASQVSLSRRRRAQGDTPEKRWGMMVAEPIAAKVIEVDRRRNRLILSERAAAREAREALKERLISELQPGEIRSGYVISLADFGAFIDIGGADGLVHRSEISWKRISHPREILKVGDKVEVKVLSLDPDRKRISLSMRELEDDPWSKVISSFHEGQLVEGTITKLTKFGAFASLSETGDYEIEGLIHISELSERRIEHPREAVAENQVLALRIIKLDQERRRIGLSLKRVDSPEYAEADWQAAMQEITADEEQAEDESGAEEAPDAAEAETTAEKASEAAEAEVEDIPEIEAAAEETPEAAEDDAEVEEELQAVEAAEAEVEETPEIEAAAEETPEAAEDEAEVEGELQAVEEAETDETEDAVDEAPEVAESETEDETTPEAEDETPSEDTPPDEGETDSVEEQPSDKEEGEDPQE